MVDHRYIQCLFRPVQGVGIEPFPGQKKGFELRQIVLFHQIGLGVLPFDGAKGRRGRKHAFDLVVGNNPPEHACIGCAHRFAFE